MAGSRGRAQAAEPLPAATTTLSTRSPPSPVTVVLDDDDLLREILFRLAFPVSLIHAALVCKRWLSLASDPAFLCPFRKLHPPLLGFYLQCSKLPFPKFVAMSHTEELSAVICRAGSVFDDYSGMRVVHFQSRNGRLLAKFHGRGSATNVVLSPLNLESNTVTLPPLQFIGQDLGIFGYLLNDQTCLRALLLLSEEQTTVHLYESIDGVCKNHISSAIEGCPVSHAGMKILPTNHRLYIVSSKNKVLVLDFTSSVLSVIELPEEVECKHDLWLSQSDDTGFNLVYVKELELRVWLYTHRTDSNRSSVGGIWLLMHTICLREVSANLRMPVLVLENGQNSTVKLHAVGHNAEFVFLEICCSIIYLDIASRMVEKVYTLAPDDGDILRIHPFMMIWPPTFPCTQRKNGPKGMMQPERAPVNANQPEVLSPPSASQGDASSLRSIVEMSGSKLRCNG